MKMVKHAHLIHKQHSTQLLIVTFALNVGASLWSILPDALVNRLPPSMIFAVSGLISIVTVGLSYIRQEKLAEAVQQSTGAPYAGPTE